MDITPDSVRQLLSSSDYGDRIKAVNHIRQLEPKDGFELIQIAIADSNARVRYSAISQLDTLGHENLDLSLQILRDRLLNDSESDVKAAAADCLGALKLSDAFDDLLHAYQTTPDWIIQVSIIAALGEFGDPRCFDLLQQALENENELVKTAAIGSLGELGDKRAIGLLAPYATSSDWQIRYRVVQALSLLGGEEAKSVLETLTNDEMEPVAAEAKKILAGT